MLRRGLICRGYPSNEKNSWRISRRADEKLEKTMSYIVWRVSTRYILQFMEISKLILQLTVTNSAPTSLPTLWTRIFVSKWISRCIMAIRPFLRIAITPKALFRVDKFRKYKLSFFKNSRRFSISAALPKVKFQTIFCRFTRRQRHWERTVAKVDDPDPPTRHQRPYRLRVTGRSYANEAAALHSLYTQYAPGTAAFTLARRNTGRY